MSDAAPILIYVRDLLFGSKIVATARAEQVPFRSVRDRSKLLELPARWLIVDLNADDGLDAAIEWKQKQGGEVIGFVAHVAGDLIARARAAGIDRVMSNGAFSSQLPTLLKQLA